ncbi:MAG TPA: DUF4136 domain-containing protein [Steroidobacteraceae bacterium]|jgi:hypothetical protein|nr:DUF4136 domain-containing protein [Steroidobacteraceae bacterium]
MSRLTVWVPVVAATAALAACQGVPVRTDQNAQLLSSVHCQSVAWAGGFKGASPLRNTIANPLNEARLRDAIAADLPRAGLTLVSEPAPTPPIAGAPAAPVPAAAPAVQCLIGYGIGMNRDVDAVYPDGWVYGGGYWGRGPRWGGGWGWGWGWGDPYVYHTSYITVDLYDAASKQPIWHASAEQNLSGLTGDAAASRIRVAVDAIFQKFPH